MSNLKKQIADYLPELRKKRKNETDPDKRHSLKIKIQELSKLIDQL